MGVLSAVVVAFAAVVVTVKLTATPAASSCRRRSDTSVTFVTATVPPAGTVAATPTANWVLLSVAAVYPCSVTDAATTKLGGGAPGGDGGGGAGGGGTGGGGGGGLMEASKQPEVLPTTVSARPDRARLVVSAKDRCNTTVLTVALLTAAASCDAV